MIRDITIGQHYPGESPVHRLDPRIKTLLTVAYVVVLFIGSNPAGLGVTLLLLALLYGAAKIPPLVVWRTVKPLIPIFLFTSIANLLFETGGTELLHFWVITVTTAGVYKAVIMIVRIFCLLMGAGLLTYTTSPIVLTDALERLMSPLGKLGFPAHELAMMMTITMRMVPTLIEETDKIMSAQKARGAELDSGGLMRRVRALVPVLIPLFLSAFHRAEELAMAMECRCYRGGDGRTRLRLLKITGGDVTGALVCMAVFTAIAATRWLVPPLFA